MYASVLELTIDGNATFANDIAGEHAGGNGRELDIVGNEVHVTTGVVVIAGKQHLSQR